MTLIAHISRTHAAAALIGAVAIVTTTALASAIDRTGSERLAGQICRSVIRLQPGESEFDACVSSLADWVERAQTGRAVALARETCFDQGLKPASADLSLCLLRAADTKPVAGFLEPLNTASAVSAEGPRSDQAYFDVSRDIKFRREQEACARLGLDPAFSAFASCVAGLQSSLQGIDMEGN
jgi:hypothetical protein